MESWVNPRLAHRIPELDGLRGVAVSLVVIVHYFSTAKPQASWLRHIVFLLLPSWSGVDLFFVLSGFLIGGILWENRRSAHYFSAFYMRRICRIWPVLFVWLGLYALASPLSVRPAWATTFAHKIPSWSYLLFVQNIFMAVRKTSGAAWLAVTWSLAVEEQFYLILPFVVFALPSVKKLAWFVGISSVAAILIRIWICSGTNFVYASYMLLQCRADALGCGVLIALAVREERIWRWLCNHRSILVFSTCGFALGFIPLLFHPYGTRLMATVGYSWVALFYSLVILLVLTEGSSALNGILRSSALRSFGAIAYGLYIIHQAILYSLYNFIFHKSHGIVTNFRELIVTIIALFISVGVASLSWKFMERPILQWAAARYTYQSIEEPLVTVS